MIFVVIIIFFNRYEDLQCPKKKIKNSRICTYLTRYKIQDNFYISKQKFDRESKNLQLLNSSTT